MNRQQILEQIPNHLRPHVEAIARGLNEVEAQPLEKIGNIVRIFGIQDSLNLLKEALDIEANGGMAKENQSERRTLGGIFFKLAKSRLPPDLVAEIRSHSESPSDPLHRAAGLLRKVAHIALVASENLLEPMIPLADHQSNVRKDIEAATQLLRETVGVFPTSATQSSPRKPSSKPPRKNSQKPVRQNKVVKNKHVKRCPICKNIFNGQKKYAEHYPLCESLLLESRVAPSISGSVVHLPKKPLPPGVNVPVKSTHPKLPPVSYEDPQRFLKNPYANE